MYQGTGLPLDERIEFPEAFVSDEWHCDVLHIDWP
jgi:hypothetical protein